MSPQLNISKLLISLWMHSLDKTHACAINKKLIQLSERCVKKFHVIYSKSNFGFSYGYITGTEDALAASDAFAALFTLVQLLSLSMLLRLQIPVNSFTEGN